MRCRKAKPLRLYVRLYSGSDLPETGLRALGAAHVLSWGRGAGSNVDLGEKTVTEGRAAGGALSQLGGQ